MRESTHTRRRAVGVRLMVAVAALATALALAACGGSSKSSGSGPAPGSSGSSTSSQSSSSGSGKSSGGVVHLTWWTMWSGAALKTVDTLVAKFNATHPTIHVSTSAIPSDATASTAKLLSSIAAGDGPDIFTEWWPEIGSFAAKGDIDSLQPYLTGNYAKFEKWEYPVAVQGGSYNNQLYSVPMSLNSWALYYNKSLLTKYGITSPPTTLAQLQTDQAKVWKTSPRLTQLGFYPDTGDNGFQFYTSYFGATNCIKAGKYDYATCPAALKEMNWIASYDSYPYGQVQALQTALGAVAGGDTDEFSSGKAAFMLSGPWEGAQNIPASNPALKGHFGVEPFPGIVGGPSTIGQGNFNVIPKGSKHPQQAFEFMAWLAGYQSASIIAPIDTQGGWIPGGPSVTKNPAYATWIKSNPWLSGFLPQMTSKYTVAPVLTPNQSQLFTAENSATDEVLQKKMTPMQALQYIDSQANG